MASVDVYILVKFGLRIPDLAWDVQEMIKKNIEEYSYKVKANGTSGIYLKTRFPPKPLHQAKSEVKQPGFRSGA